MGHLWAAPLAHARELAEVLLRAVAAGAPVDALAGALAEATLAGAEVTRLAGLVLVGGDHRVARAIELAEAVLAPARGTARQGAR